METIESLSHQVETLKKENIFLKSLIIKYIGVSTKLTEASKNLKIAFSALHTTANDVVGVLKELPIEDYKNMPDSLKSSFGELFK